MTRQAMFKPDGTITDVPTKLTENPQLEKQLDLLQYPKDQALLSQLEPSPKDLVHKEAGDYIKRIKNHRKKLYARAYLGYLLGKRSEPDYSSYALGYMAGQSVRIHLEGLIERG